MVSLLFLPSCNTPPLKKKTTIPVRAGALYNVLYREAAPEVQPTLPVYIPFLARLPQIQLVISAAYFAISGFHKNG